MYQEKSVVFVAEERLSTGEPIIYTDPTAAIMRGRALQGIFVKQFFGKLFSAIGAKLVRGYRAYRSRVELMKLDDRMLADIGISRAEAAAIASGKRYEDESGRGSKADEKRAIKAPAHFQPAH